MFVKEIRDTQSLHDEENLVMPPDIKQISEAIEVEREFAEPGFTFSSQKASIRVPKIMQKSENKQQGRICRKNNFQNNKVNMINNVLRSACDSLRFHFVDNSSIVRNQLAGDEIYFMTFKLCRH